MYQLSGWQIWFKHNVLILKQESKLSWIKPTQNLRNEHMKTGKISFYFPIWSVVSHPY